MLTMLSRLFQTSQEVDLDVRVFWLVRKLDFVPSLSGGPSTGFSVAQDLLVDVEDPKLGGNSLEAIWLVDMGVYVLQLLEDTRLLCLILILKFGSSRMLLEMEQRSRVLLAVHRPLRNKFCRYHVYGILQQVGFLVIHSRLSVQSCPRPPCLQPLHGVVDNTEDGLFKLATSSKVLVLSNPLHHSSVSHPLARQTRHCQMADSQGC
jgi:hypothetical protein